MSLPEGLPSASWLSTPVGGEEDAPSGPEIFDAFKDTQGRFRTQSLFYETRHRSYPAFFTTKKRDIVRDGRTYHSLYLKYMDISDPTEYQVAIRLFGSWEHWQAMNKAKWFTDLVTGWREELRTKLESARYFEMKDQIKSNPKSPQAIQATKWLAERYGEKEVVKRGRPSKAEKARHLKTLEENTAELDEDIERLGL